MQPEYEIRMDVAHGGMEPIALDEIVASCPHDWFNQSLCRVNESIVRVGVFKGEFHFHKHDREDEFFFVVRGSLVIEFEDHSVPLGERQGIMVPRGVVHRPVARERAVVLMVEGDTITPTGDT